MGNTVPRLCPPLCGGVTTNSTMHLVLPHFDSHLTSRYGLVLKHFDSDLTCRYGLSFIHRYDLWLGLQTSLWFGHTRQSLWLGLHTLLWFMVRSSHVVTVRSYTSVAMVRSYMSLWFGPTRRYGSVLTRRSDSVLHVVMVRSYTSLWFNPHTSLWSGPHTS